LLGIKGTKRSSPLATEIVVKRALYRLKKRNKQARILHLYMSGVGRGRSVVRKALIGSRLKIHMIREITAIPHNGTRKPSRRRV
jgi:small subunit ribosomal protein S11